ncbi:MAG TPA: amidohydrolase family protein [Terriglobales bacterium]|nr:amidohydrolase family protein [Terriglobales bacterium]
MLPKVLCGFHRKASEIAGLLVLTGLLSGLMSAQDPPPWKNDPLFQRLAGALDPVAAIDTHTHLLGLGAMSFDPKEAAQGPVLLRSTHPWLPAMIKARFDVTVDPRDWVLTDKSIANARAAMIKKLGEHGYWINHLDYTNTEVVLVNSNIRQGTDGQRLRWVPTASILLYPLAADHLMARSPRHKDDIATLQRDLQGVLKEANLTAVPEDFGTYIIFVDQTLHRWQKQGAVAVKFIDAYLRTLHIAEISQVQAARLYAEGQKKPLSRDEYIALQDFVWRHILLEAGKLHLVVHIHSSLGIPPFMRTYDSDVSNLDDVLTDPQFFATPIVLIHGGLPWHEIAAYQALKPNVWIDISTMAFLYPVPAFADRLRAYLVLAPEKVLYGTDAAPYPSVVGGADVLHIMLSRATRDALYLGLAGLVRDSVINEAEAVAIGRGVLRDNARRLYGWK